MCAKTEYLNETLTFIENNGKRYIVSKSNNQEINQQLNLGGVHQVLTSKYGFKNIEHSTIAREWVRKFKVIN